jgi:hypothetical protein
VQRTATFLAAWVLAAVVATAIAWQGVGIVGDQVTTSRPAALDQAAVRAELASGPDGAAVDATSTTSTVPETLTDEVASGLSAPAAPLTAPATSAPPRGAAAPPTTSRPSPPTTSRPSPPPVQAPPATTAAPPPPTTAPPTTAGPPTTTAPTTAPPPTAAPAEVRTYSLVGGSVALRFSSSGVSVDYATPNPGFSVDIEPEHGNGVKVEFESEEHESRVDGWWDGGPRDRVREDAG